MSDRLGMAGVRLTSEELERVTGRYLAAVEERRSLARGLEPETIPDQGCDLSIGDRQCST